MTSQAAADRRLAWSRQEKLSARIWAKDHTVWSPTVVPELVDRLGWLALPGSMEAEAAGFAAFADEIRADGVAHVVLLGMGGSSLAPEVFQGTFGPRDAYPTLLVLDSTHPDAVAAVERRVDLSRTLFVVSSKSGGTSETMSFFRYFWAKYPANAGRHFIAITDPGTSLEALARERGFRRVFNAPPDVGGRYSALTPFGLVPAALVGVNVAHLLEHARAMSSASGPDSEGEQNPSVALGVVLADLALGGRDKVTFLVSRSVALLPAWIEQLVAESTGKHGKGILPVADEAPLARPRSTATTGCSSRSASRAKTRSPWRTRRDRWPPRGIRSSRSPSARRSTWARSSSAGNSPPPPPAPCSASSRSTSRTCSWRKTSPARRWRAEALPRVRRRARSAARRTGATGWRAGWHPSGRTTTSPSTPTCRRRPTRWTRCSGCARRLGSRTRAATTLGLGPRFLHSTGQLHKGGPDTGLFLQLVDEPQADLPVPETTYTFGQLIRAQAAGDAMALEQRGRRVLRINLGADAKAGLETLAGMI